MTWWIDPLAMKNAITDALMAWRNGRISILDHREWNYCQ